MRYPPEHKLKTIDKIVRKAGSLAKKNGFGTTGIDALMKSAGLTTGAFYKHFTSKEALLASMVEHEFARTDKLLFATDSQDTSPLKEMAERYLTMAHIAHPEKGCMLPALSNEVARADKSTQSAYAKGLESVHATLSGSASPDNAWAILSMAVGAITLARACGDSGMQHDILRAVASQMATMDAQASTLSK